MQLNDENIRKIITPLIKDKHSLYIDNVEYPNYYTLDIFTGKNGNFYTQILIEKNKNYTKEELEKLVKKAELEKQKI